MYGIGQPELDRISEVFASGNLFRYLAEGGAECERFEKRYAERLGVRHCVMTASGTNALTAALIGAGVGPGDEVIVPACTYMATPMAVLAAGAIPVIVDIDESLGMCPAALSAIVGSRTRAVIPVHMWGLPCDMDAIMAIAADRGLLVIEDACQAVGGAYEGKMLGSIGHIGAFSFNYYKNMSCGEGGAVVTGDDSLAERIGCAIDPCRFYWDGRSDSFAGFTANGARASEIEGAVMNCQLDRLDGMIATMRAQKRSILRDTAACGLTASPGNSPDWECGSHVSFLLPSPAAADALAEAAGGFVALKTGRHVYTEWDPVLAHRGAHHAALNPFELEQNRGCRMEYTKETCRGSLDILARTVLIRTHPDYSDAEVTHLISRITMANSTPTASPVAVPVQ
jgi:dTDP-4-amino-4,6-dideoxygalactose transaminase